MIKSYIPYLISTMDIEYQTCLDIHSIDGDISIAICLNISIQYCHWDDQSPAVIIRPLSSFIGILPFASTQNTLRSIASLFATRC